MDPNASLANIMLAMAAAHTSTKDGNHTDAKYHREDAIDLLHNLADWLDKGGALPYVATESYHFFGGTFKVGR